jgi:hypothetical protein
LAQPLLHAATELGGGHGLPSGEKLEIVDEKEETLRLATAKKGHVRPVVAREAEEVPTTQPGEVNDVLVLSMQKNTSRKSLEWRFMSGQSIQS